MTGLAANGQPRGMTDYLTPNDPTGTQLYRLERAVGEHNPRRHGRPASWVLVGVVIAAFIAGGFALVYHLWWLFWLCAAIFVLSVPAGWLIRIMDDTVMLGGPVDDDRPPAPDQGSVADPGVRMD